MSNHPDRVVFHLKVPQSERSKIKAARFRDTEFLSPSFRCIWCCTHEEVMNQRMLCCSSQLPDQHWKSKRHGESEVGHKRERGGNGILASKQTNPYRWQQLSSVPSTPVCLTVSHIPAIFLAEGNTYIISQGVPREVVFLIMLLQSCKFHSL